MDSFVRPSYSHSSRRSVVAEVPDLVPELANDSLMRTEVWRAVRREGGSWVYGVSGRRMESLVLFWMTGGVFDIELAIWTPQWRIKGAVGGVSMVPFGRVVWFCE